MKERRGRGRLSSLDLLPPEAKEAVDQAWAAIRERKLTQDDIRDQLNTSLLVMGLPEISRSAFNRAVVRAARLSHRLGEVREIASALASRFEEGGDEHVTLLLSETIKTLVLEILENAGTLRADGKTAEMMMNFAGALKSAEQAKKVSADTKRLIEDRFKKDAEAAITAVAARKGLSRETVETIKAELFGVRAAA